MYTCDKCHGTRPCPSCDVPAEQVVRPCDLPSALWVRVSERGGPRLKDVQVRVSEVAAKPTVDNGFAVFDPVPPRSHTIELELAVNDVSKKYKSAEPKQQGVAAGQTALVTFELDPLANAKVDPERVVLFVKGKPKKLLLTTDEALRGSGTITGVDTNHLADVEQAQEVGAEISLQAKDHPTSWDGLSLTWSLDVVPGKTATAKVCVVKATMEPCWPLDEQPSDPSQKLDPGVVVALKTDSNDKPPRAKVRLAVEPREFDGTLQIQSKASKVRLFAAAEGPDEITEIQGPFTDEKAFFVEGATVSGTKLDEEVVLLADGDELDRFVVTVVRAELVIHEDVVRGAGLAEDTYTPIDDKARTMFADPKHKLLRAKLLLTKSPWDAPCQLEVSKEGAGDVVVYRKDRKLPLGSKNPTKSNELYDKDEAALPLPSDHEVSPGCADPTADFVDDNPVWLWLEGATVGEARLSVGIDRVQAKVDMVTLTVRKPKLRIEVTRAFRNPPPTPGEIAVKLFVMKDGSELLNAFPSLADTDSHGEVEVDVDDYRIALDPQAVGEKVARVVRTEPEGDDAAISVTADTTVKFELAPRYDKVQFIAYWVFTGQSKGIDAEKDSHADRVTEARNDMKAKAALMKAAILKLRSDRAGDLEGPDTLKIFMAPEFTFRGAQGAYPIDVVSEVFKELEPEIDDSFFDDWLFVAGTGVGTVTSPEAVTDPSKIVQATTRTIYAQSKTTGPPHALVWAYSEAPAMPNAERYAYWLDYPGPARPLNGWAMLDPHVGSVVATGVPPSGPPWVLVDHHRSVVQPNGDTTVPVKFVDPPEVEIANVALVRKGGKKVPSGGDGRGLRQALINKEYVAWGDLPTSVDLNHEMFFYAGRQLVTLYGLVCRAKPPADSTMEGTYVPSWNWVNGPPPKTEKSPSGIGGGSAFTFDQIRFGLEICMDHNFQRLRKSIPVDQKPHVHLVPSGGASINANSVWTVDQGLVFNVDMSHHRAQKGGGDIALKGAAVDLTLDSSAHYNAAAKDDVTQVVVGNGKVFIYEPADIAYG